MVEFAAGAEVVEGALVAEPDELARRDPPDEAEAIALRRPAPLAGSDRERRRELLVVGGEA